MKIHIKTLLIFKFVELHRLKATINGIILGICEEIPIETTVINQKTRFPIDFLVFFSHFRRF